MRQVILSEHWYVKDGSIYEVSADVDRGGKEGGFWERGHVESSGEVDGHHVIYFRGQDKLDSDLRQGAEILGVEHDSDEVLNRIYECAVEYGKDLARLHNAEFIDMTERHKQESKLEGSVSP